MAEEDKTEPEATAATEEPSDEASTEEASADQPASDEAEDQQTETEEGEAPKKKGKGQLIGIILGAVLVVFGGVGAGLYFSGAIDSVLASEEAPSKQKELALGAPVYHSYPEMLVDLRTGECRAPFLRFTLVVQISEADKPLLDTYEARIIDRIQNHIRSYERQDVLGLDGADRLRTDLVVVINNIIKPAQVHAVLFNTFILN